MSTPGVFPPCSFSGRLILRGPADGNRIALTFDDGPCSGYTEQILDILRSHDVKATFFVCGQNVERCPEILRRVQAEGHTIGNHSYSHPFPFFRSRAFFAREIDLTQEAIEKVTGRTPKVLSTALRCALAGASSRVEAAGPTLGELVRHRV